jgi:hypothetical protein
MSLTQDDLQGIRSVIHAEVDQSIKGLEASIEKKLKTQKGEILAELESTRLALETRLDKKLAQQTKEIAHVINQAMATVDERYATKAELESLRQEVRELRLAMR